MLSLQRVGNTASLVEPATRAGDEYENGGAERQRRDQSTVCVGLRGIPQEKPRVSGASIGAEDENWSWRETDSDRIGCDILRERHPNSDVLREHHQNSEKNREGRVHGTLGQRTMRIWYMVHPREPRRRNETQRGLPTTGMTTLTRYRLPEQQRDSGRWTKDEGQGRR